jgi:hypothetical protein
LNNAPTPEGRGHQGPHEAEPLFPSEGPFNPVVPLSEIGDAHAPRPSVNAADVGLPAEAAWAREAHRARLKEDEETLVPSRSRHARGARRSWAFTASVLAFSVFAGVASGSYLIWTSQRAHEPQPPVQVAAEAQLAQPAPVAAEQPPTTEVEKASEPVKEEKAREVLKSEKSEKSEKTERSDEKSTETARVSKQSPPLQTATRAERVARAAAEPERPEPAPRPARVQSVTAKSTRAARAEARPAPALGRDLPISSPPPSAKSKRVIQWP